MITLKPNTTHRSSFKAVFLLLLALCFPLPVLGQTADPFPPPDLLDENCVATANNIAVTVNPNGTFSLSGPLPLGQYRVRVVCERDGVVTQGQSGFLEGILKQGSGIEGGTGKEVETTNFPTFTIYDNGSSTEVRNSSNRPIDHF